MARDYKYEIQMIAEEVAERDFGHEFYDLPDETQYEIFRGAEEAWAEKAQQEADLLADRLENW